MPISLKSRRVILTPRLDQIKDPLTQQIFNDFAKILKDIAQNVYDDLNQVALTKVLNFTHDLTTASGDHMYLGFGFQPRCAFIMAGVDGAVANSIGMADGSKVLDMSGQGNIAADQIGMDHVSCINLIISAGNTQTAVLKQFTNDGMILTWTKTGSPTGTAKIFVLAFS